MAVRPVLRMGHPLLRERSREVTKKQIKSPEFQTLLQDMIDTMHAEMGVGIAAPQIGELLRVSVIEFEENNERYPEMGAQGLSVFINPVLTVIDNEEQSFWEGCLSVPGLRGLVPRPRKVKVEYLDQNGDEQVLVAEGFMATVLQHEFDHLDGILYIDRVQDTRQLAFMEEFRQFIVESSEHDELED